MATNHTEHYQLSQWTAEDSFLREEFNEDFRKIDQALSLKCQAVVGAYQGDGEDSQKIDLGFTPKAVLVIGDSGLFTENGYHYGGMAVGPIGSAPGVKGERIEVAEGGFVVYFPNRTYPLNNAGWHYYIAFR